MELIKFSSTDGVYLNGFLYKTNPSTKNIILSVHGMSSNAFKTREVEISQKAKESNIDYFCFNNRGSELVRYVKRNVNGEKEKILAGTSYEDPLDGYFDIVGAILKLKEFGYENIYLQGHSLGCTKAIYTYQKLKEENSELLKNIKGLILLSLVDINHVLKEFLGNKYNYYFNLAEEKEKQGNLMDLMPKEAFIHPVSVKTYLRYIRDYKKIDVDNYNIVTSIDLPVFMRWGTDNEMIVYEPDEIVKIVSDNIKHNKKDIGYIEGANHSYNGYEEVLAKEVIKFVKGII